MSSHLQCPSAHQTPGVVIVAFLELLFLLTVFFSLLPVLKLEVNLHFLFSLLVSCTKRPYFGFSFIFYQNSQHFVPLLFDGGFLTFKTR